MDAKSSPLAMRGLGPSFDAACEGVAITILVRPVAEGADGLVDEAAGFDLVLAVSGLDAEQGPARTEPDLATARFEQGENPDGDDHLLAGHDRGDVGVLVAAVPRLGAAGGTLRR